MASGMSRKRDFESTFHKRIELIVGVFICEEVHHFLRIVNLLLLVRDFVVGDRDPELLCQYLLIDILDLVAWVLAV
jgi:hypothetical protein